MESELAFALMRKTIATPSLTNEIASVSAIPKCPGRLFIEADNMGLVWKLCAGIFGIYPRQMEMIPVDDRAALLSHKPSESDPKQNTWVRIMTGLYKGDVGLVESRILLIRELSVLVVPRIDTSTVSRKRKGGKKKVDRPEPSLANKQVLKDLFGDDVYEFAYDEATDDEPEGEHWYLFRNRLFTETGLESITISYSEVSQYYPDFKEARPIIFAASLHWCSEWSEVPDYKSPLYISIGSTVEIVAGTYTGSLATVTQTPAAGEEVVTVILEPSTLDVIQVHVLRSEILRYFRPGDSVEVKVGINVGQRGMVLERCAKRSILILNDSTLNTVRVQSSMVITTANTTSTSFLSLPLSVILFNGMPCVTTIPQTRAT